MQKGDMCIDAGTENCPCILAETGDCIVCGKLQDKDCCNCNWQGVCIYNEYIQGNKKINNKRENFKSEVVKKIWYSHQLAVFVLQVGKGFALKASVPGSYVFVQPEGTSPWHCFPVSVMLAEPEKGLIHIAIRIVSGKTKGFREAKDRIQLRGVYRNGIIGVGKLIDCRKKNILIVTKGVGIAPAILSGHWIGKQNDLTLFIDMDKITGEMVADYLDNALGKKISFGDLGEELEKRNLESYDLIGVMASDHFIREVKKKLSGEEKKLIYTNNCPMCCGEGLCGACSVTDEKGVSHKMCKCQCMI